MTKLVAVRVALAWATNVQKMLNDAKRFKKSIELCRNTLSGTCLRSLCVTLNVLYSVHRMIEYFLVETLEAVKIVIFYVGKKNITIE